MGKNKIGNSGSENNTNVETVQNPKKKLKYTKPKLILYGKISKLTLGGSPGTGESGMEQLFRNPMN